MYNEELLQSIKEQGEGVISTRRDYHIVLDAAKKQAEQENRPYDYSYIRTIVFDGKNTVKLTYVDLPSVNGDHEYDPLKDYTSFRYLKVTLDELAKAQFVK